MVSGIHPGVSFITVPKFPDGRCAVFSHVTPARIGGLGGEGVGYISMPVLCQGPH